MSFLLLGGVRLLSDDCLQLRPHFTGLDAIVPSVTKFGVPSTSAISEPGTAATTTTVFPRFRHGTAFGAHGADALLRHG